MHILYPISASQPNWDYLKQAFAEGLNINIDSGITTNRLKKDLSAFIGTLGMNNEPLKDSRSASARTLKHVSFGFAMITDFDTMKFVIDSKIACSLERCSDDRTYFILATGSLNDWVDACFEACSIHSPEGLRLMFNKIVMFFEVIKLKGLMNNFQKKKLSDGTFALTKKTAR